MSEFGKGFTYCLGMFLAHTFMFKNFDSEEKIGETTLGQSSLWCFFNGASDHLYELQIPDNFVFAPECLAWKNKVLHLGHGVTHFEHKYSEEDVDWALTECRKFLMAWDKQCGIEVEQGKWE